MRLNINNKSFNKRALITLAISLMSAFALIGQEGLVANYDFNNDLSDLSSNSEDAILQGGAFGQDRFSNNSNALTFSSHLELVKLPATIIDGLSDVSISVWFKTDHGGVIISGANSTRPNEYVIQVLDDGRISSNIRNTHNIPGIPIFGTANVKDNQWHHLYLFRNGTNGDSFIFVDGVIDGQGNMPSGSLSIEENGLYLGNDQDCLSGCWDINNQWIGSIDDLRIYDRELTSEELTLLSDFIPPIFTSGFTENYSENGVGAAYTAMATDANTITYSLGSSNDEALFDIGTSSGAVTFKIAPNFEVPTNANADNIYILEVIASDGLNTANQLIRLTVVNINEVPIFKSSPALTLNNIDDYEYIIEVDDQEDDELSVEWLTTPLPWLKLTESGQYDVSTFAGSGVSGSSNGNGLEASFNNIGRIVIDQEENIYVLDVWNNRIRKVDKEGNVSNFAGTGNNGYKDGPASEAEFNGLSGIAIDHDGNLFVSDFYNNVIRKITKNGVVSTFAGDGQGGFMDGTGLSSRFNGPSGLDFDGDGNLYLADLRNNRIRKIDKNGVVNTLAGGFSSQHLDGQGTDARFENPKDLTIDPNGNIFVISNLRIRKIAPDGIVTTFAGNGSPGDVNGVGTNAQFIRLNGITSDNSGNLFVTDESNKIKRIGKDAQVSTLMGSGLQAERDGTGNNASFSRPYDISFSTDRTIFITDFSSNVIRKAKLLPQRLTGNPAGQAGLFSITLKVSDENSISSEQSFNLEVKDITKPVFTSPTIMTFRENEVSISYTSVATDNNTITYSLGSSNDEALF
ncbi:LamG-like jellyroll fold domain-containing protein, partial [Roseivirga sp.]|uniref:LamG-like jellyroll fold domain-containing protein n=1 Tax=Roseivirga sp. TaxID=1964215 RepID=UPI003B8C2E46